MKRLETYIQFICPLCHYSTDMTPPMTLYDIMILGVHSNHDPKISMVRILAS